MVFIDGELASHKQIEEWKEKAELFDKLYIDHNSLGVKYSTQKQKLEAIKNACLLMDTIDTAHRIDENAKLPRRILEILRENNYIKGEL